MVTIDLRYIHFEIILIEIIVEQDIKLLSEIFFEEIRYEDSCFKIEIFILTTFEFNLEKGLLFIR